MPKGVYDRTKTKAQRSAEKAEKATVQKRKYTKRAQEGVFALTGTKAVAHPANDLFELRASLSLLADAYQKVDNVQVRTLLASKMTQIVETILPAEVKQAARVEKAEKVEKTEKVEAAQVPAIPYPAPLPFNGANPQS